MRHPNFRLLWFTSVINAASNWIQQVTLGWLAYDLTGSALTAAIVFGMRSLPNLIMGPIGGVFGDRFERKKGLLINSGFLSALAMAFALLLAVGRIETWHLLLFTLLQGMAQSLVNPVRQAMVANTVPREDLMNAIALNAFAQNAMRVIGPAVAGVMIAVSGPALNFGLQGISYVIVFVMLLPIKTPYTDFNPRTMHHGSIRDSFGQGISYVRTQPTTLGLLLMALVPTLFTTPVNLGLLPVFARDVLHVDSQGLGLLYSAQGIGAVVGTLALASLGNYPKKGLILAVAAVLLTIGITSYSQIGSFFVAIPFLAATTCCFMTYQTLNQTIIQMTTPDEYRGRVVGLQMMDHGLQPLGIMILGAIAEVYGVQTAILLSGICGMTCVTLILLRFPSIRSYRSDASREVPASQSVQQTGKGGLAVEAAGLGSRPGPDIAEPRPFNL